MKGQAAFEVENPTAAAATAASFPDRRNTKASQNQTLSTSGQHFAPADRALRQTPQGLRHPNNSVWFTPDASFIAAGQSTQQGQLFLWDLRTGASSIVADIGSGRIAATALAPDGTTFCVAGVHRGLGAYSLRKGALGNAEASAVSWSSELLWEALPGTTVIDVAFSSNGQHLASVSVPDKESGVLEVRSARNGDVIFALNDGFVANFTGWEPGSLAYSTNLLAVSGRNGVPSSEKLVRLFAISDYKMQHELRFEGQIFSLALNHGGTRLAVGLSPKEQLEQSAVRSSLVHVFDPRDWDALPQRIPYHDHHKLGYSIAVSVHFNHEGNMLVVGYYSHGTKGHFAVWNIETLTCERVYRHRGSDGHACAFSPANDLLVCGGNQEPLVVHELVPHAAPAKITMPGIEELPIKAACVSSELSVMATDTRLVGYWHKTQTLQFEVPIDLAGSVWGIPLILRPDGKQLALHFGATREISICDGSGKEIHRLKIDLPQNSESQRDPEFMGQITYSPDSKWLSVAGHFSTQIFDTNTFSLEHTIVDNLGPHSKWHGHRGQKIEPHVHCCHFDPSGQYAAQAGWPGNANVWKTNAGKRWEIVCDLNEEKMGTGGGIGGLCFDDAGERLAYFLEYQEGRSIEAPIRQIIVREVGGDWSVLHRFDTSYHWVQQLYFSPGAGEYILITNGNGDTEQFQILEADSGVEAPWSMTLKVMLLPDETPTRRTVGWVLPILGESSSVAASTSLFLHVGFGTTLHLIDVSRFIHTFEEDSNFSVAQLSCLSDTRNQNLIPVLTKSWPHVINIADPESGDTVLHCCARGQDNHEAVLAWLSGSAPFSLLKNDAGHSQVWECVHNMAPESAMEMFKRLDPGLLPERTSALTQDLVMVGETWQAQLVDFIEVLENPKFYGLFRQQREINFLKKNVDDFVVRGTPNWNCNLPWDGYEGEATVICKSAQEVLALRAFAGPPIHTDGDLSSPFCRLLKATFKAKLPRSELNRLMMTKLFRTTTYFKWISYTKQRVVWQLLRYALQCALAAAAMLASSSQDQRLTDVADALQSLMLLSNTFLMLQEAKQCRAAGVAEYLLDFFNWLDIGGIFAMYIAGAAHFNNWRDVLATAGAIGVLLNTFSLLQTLRSFQTTGYLIVIIRQVWIDILPFLGIMSVLLYGFSTAFAISMPSNDEYQLSSKGMGGPLSGIVASYLAMLGFVEPVDYANPTAAVMFLLFMLLMVVVMMNLLIAIMTDSYEKVGNCTSQYIHAFHLHALQWHELSPDR
jgi:WD40 repeat protein